MAKTYSIYRLFDRRNAEVTRYVGMTSDLETRFAQHLSCNGENPGKDAWIQTPGVEVDKEVIETQESLPEAKGREAYWINYYLLQDMPLTNQFIPSLTPKASRRNTERYAYFSVGILRDSETLRKFLQDAKECGMLQKLPKLLVMRIADFYRQTFTAVSTRTVQPPALNITEDPEEETIQLDLAAINANAALDEWG